MPLCGLLGFGLQGQQRSFQMEPPSSSPNSSAASSARVGLKAVLSPLRSVLVWRKTLFLLDHFGPVQPRGTILQSGATQWAGG